jgi:serine/threonine-protein kinase
MSLEAELLLPSDVEIFAVRDLAPDVRARIDALEDDWAITRPRARGPTRIVDRDSADLLAIFRAPTRIVDAVLTFSGKRGLDPEATLEQAYPMLSRLYQSKLLVSASALADATPIRSRLEIGGVVEGFRLLRSVQVLEDNEVFLAREATGRYAAVKFYREPTTQGLRALEHEAAMLRRIPGHRAPQVYAITRTNDGVALVTEWIFGSDAANMAAGLRGRREVRSEMRLLAMCVDVAQAFADLHRVGVLHGDVHPRNVLIDTQGSARLIDFGLAQRTHQRSRRVPRGGVAFYFDPEFADAQRKNRSTPLTESGEQYSVAALLYQLFTGIYYLDWSLERDKLLRQIIEDEMISFEARSVTPWPALEGVLRRALDKQPDRRFRDMTVFADALRALTHDAETRDRTSAIYRRERAREQELLDRALSRYALTGRALRDGLADAPFVSINYGAAGVAYALHRIAKLRADPKLLALADVWTQKGFALASHEKAFYNSAIEIEPKTVGRVSLFHSLTGLYCVRALVSIAMGDIAAANRAVQSFVHLSRGPCESVDLTLGKASLLLGCSELLETTPAGWLVDVGLARERGGEIARELVTLLESEQMTTSTRHKTLGAAHGWGGYLFALLRWANATASNPHPVVRDKLEELASLAEPHGGGMRWPIQNAAVKPAFMDGWCNGTAGHVMLFALAYRVLGVTSFAEMAERAAVSAWKTGLSIGTLCCGLGGLGYAYAALYRIGAAEIWLERARASARRAATDSTKYFLLDALYKGAVGVALLAEELKSPKSAAMPLVEPSVSD